MNRSRPTTGDPTANGVLSPIPPMFRRQKVHAIPCGYEFVGPIAPSSSTSTLDHVKAFGARLAMKARPQDSRPILPSNLVPNPELDIQLDAIFVKELQDGTAFRRPIALTGSVPRAQMAPIVPSILNAASQAQNVLNALSASKSSMVLTVPSVLNAPKASIAQQAPTVPSITQQHSEPLIPQKGLLNTTVNHLNIDTHFSSAKNIYQQSQTILQTQQISQAQRFSQTQQNLKTQQIWQSQQFSQMQINPQQAGMTPTFNGNINTCIISTTHAQQPSQAPQYLQSHIARRGLPKTPSSNININNGVPQPIGLIPQASRANGTQFMNNIQQHLHSQVAPRLLLLPGMPEFDPYDLSWLKIAYPWISAQVLANNLQSGNNSQQRSQLQVTQQQFLSSIDSNGLFYPGAPSKTTSTQVPGKCMPAANNTQQKSQIQVGLPGISGFTQVPENRLQSGKHAQRDSQPQAGQQQLPKTLGMNGNTNNLISSFANVPASLIDAARINQVQSAALSQPVSGQVSATEKVKIEQHATIPEIKGNINVHCILPPMNTDSNRVLVRQTQIVMDDQAQHTNTPGNDANVTTHHHFNNTQQNAQQIPHQKSTQVSTDRLQSPPSASTITSMNSNIDPRLFEISQASMIPSPPIADTTATATVQIIPPCIPHLSPPNVPSGFQPTFRTSLPYPSFSAHANS